MMSIRKRLLIRLLAGLGVLWGVVGMTVYLTIRQSLEGEFDAELEAMASEVRHLIPEGRYLQEATPSSYWIDFFHPGSGLYFEVWDEFFIFSDRSPSLGEGELPRPARFSAEPFIWQFSLDSGERMRGIAQQFALTPAPETGWMDDPGAEVRRINVVVARDRSRLDQRLGVFRMITALIGVLLIPLSFLLVRLTVGWGVGPLAAFADDVAEFGAESLDERFQTQGLPEELLPVAQRLNEFLDRLGEGLERERRLNADLAHELRTPVAELKTMAEVALTWPDKIDSGHFREVLNAATQMQTIVESMLQLARWDRCGEEPDVEPVHLCSFVDACWKPLQEDAARKELHLHRDLPDTLVLETNPSLFRVILANLLANAVEYCPPGGKLDIIGGSEGGRFRLIIGNTVGEVKPDDLSHMFERFWRHDPARAEGGHAGLGLPLVQTCARILGLELSSSLETPENRLVFELSKGGAG